MVSLPCPQQAGRLEAWAGDGTQGQAKREAWCREAQDMGVMASAERPWSAAGLPRGPGLQEWLQAPPGPPLCTLPKPSCWGETRSVLSPSQLQVSKSILWQTWSLGPESSLLGAVFSVLAARGPPGRCSTIPVSGPIPGPAKLSGVGPGHPYFTKAAPPGDSGMQGELSG